MYENLSLVPGLGFLHSKSVLKPLDSFKDDSPLDFLFSFWLCDLLEDLGLTSTILSFMTGPVCSSTLSLWLLVSTSSPRSPQLQWARSGLCWPKGRLELISSLRTMLLTFLLGRYHLTRCETTATSPLFSRLSRSLSHFRWVRVCRGSQGLGLVRTERYNLVYLVGQLLRQRHQLQLVSVGDYCIFTRLFLIHLQILFKPPNFLFYLSLVPNVIFVFDRAECCLADDDKRDLT